MKISEQTKCLLLILLCYLGTLWVAIAEVGAIRARVDKKLLQFGDLYYECRDVVTDFSDDVKYFSYQADRLDEYLNEKEN